MRMSLLDVDDLDPELREGLTRWLAEGGDPNFYRLFGRLPERLKHFIRFYSPLVRRGLVETARRSWSGCAWLSSTSATTE